jgi:hypothetical protein
MKLAFIAAVLMATPVFAQDDATGNRAWGDISSQVARSGIMGEHSSSHGTFTPDPGEGGRTGVGNVSKSFGELSDGAQGTHAIVNGSRLGSDSLPEGSIESTVGPFSCQRC